MKKYSFLFLATALLLVTSCANEANTAEEKNSGDSVSNADTRTNPPAARPQEYAPPPSKVEVKEVEKKDTPRTSVSIGKDGAEVKTKKGTEVSYDKDGIKVGSKKVKIDIKRDTL